MMDKLHFGHIDEYHQHKTQRQVKKPICKKCKKECNPAGGIVGEVTTFWKCFKCNYEVEDVAVLVLPNGD